MATPPDPRQWAHYSGLIDEALDLSGDAQREWLARLRERDGDAADFVARMLGRMSEDGGTDGLFTDLLRDAQDDVPVFEGHLIGPYRLVRRIGAGGMGEVWLAERREGGFAQRVAIKLVRAGTASDRFNAEREILAVLDHPGIARLFDGGVTVEGRPYMVMEYVEGVDLTSWCRAQAAPLDRRLDLFLQVCDALAYAHAHLVVHRDLKPSNILVTPDGRAKLLDFGIAKLLQPDVEDQATRTQHLSPAYAAPEQIGGGAITTATDVYALGVTLFELLCDRLPWMLAGLPLGPAVQRLMQEPAPLPSAVAGADAPVPARRLRGDLDAIVHRSLRKEPRARYVDARAVADDLRRHLENKPVLAREGARVYVLRRFLRRHWVPLSAAALVFASLVAAIVGIAWQAQRAQAQAARATATKDFLVSLFRASDPRIAADKPRDQITAKELLDLGALRIEKEFVGQPELQIELLGLTVDIYEGLADEEHLAAQQQKLTQLALAHFGPEHPLVIEGLLKQIQSTINRPDDAKIRRLFDEADRLLTASGRDHSLQRADWWKLKAWRLAQTGEDEAERRRAVTAAIALFEALSPHAQGLADVLSQEGIVLDRRGEHAQARPLHERAIAVAEASPSRNDVLLKVALSNYALNLMYLGDFGAADAVFDRADDLARRTVGETHSEYWVGRVNRAVMMHRSGERERAHAIFDEMLPKVRDDWRHNNYDMLMREQHAAALVAEGRLQEAVPMLEAAYAKARVGAMREADVRWLRRRLGDVYDRVGRPADARRELKAALDEFLAKEPPDRPAVLAIRERWARFLLEHAQPPDADFAAAESEFRAVVAAAADRPLIEAALARAGLSRAAAARGDTATALAESRSALAGLDRVRGLFDVRMRPYCWLVHSRALRLGGDTAGARAWAQRALDASRRYDDPTSAAIAEAEAAVRSAGG